MARFTLRLDDALYDRLLASAISASTTPSAYVRDLLERFEGLDPAGYHGRFDELHATMIQTFAILAASVGTRSPELLRKGMDDARNLLRERGLLDPEQDRA